MCRDGLERIAGILRTADLLKVALNGSPLDIEKHLRPPLYVPEGVTTTHLLESFRRDRQQCALIVDEYGELQGMVTLTDVLTSIVGELPSASDPDEEVVRREDGSWLVDGGASIERLKMTIAIEDDLPGEVEKAYNTLGGLVMFVLGRIPVVSDTFEAAGFRFEIVDMDKNRVNKVIVSRLPEPEPGDKFNKQDKE